VIEVGLGGARHSACAACADVFPQPSGTVSAHVAAGVLERRGLSVYLSEDAGAEFSFEVSGDSSEYQTAFVELAAANVPVLALRVGGGQRTATALSSGLHRSGGILHADLAARTPALRRNVSALVEVDGFTGVGGHYTTHSAALDAGLRPAFRPSALQVSVGLRANVPLS
jgi:hypothetical protein